MIMRILDALRRISERRRISRRLQALDDHQLHDLGVTRDQINAYVRAATRRSDLPAG